MLKAGKLRHRVTIQKQVEVQDANTGAVSVEWSNVATVWAAVEPISAREFIASESETSKITTRIIIRYRSDVDAKMRLLHNKKGVNFYYNIEGILADKDSGLEYITLPCSEGVRYETGDVINTIPVNTVIPEILGTVGVGLIVLGNRGTWTNAPTSYLYQWYLDGEPITGANGTLTGSSTASLTVPNNVGSELVFAVSAINSTGSSDIIFSDSEIISDSSDYVIADDGFVVTTDDGSIVIIG